MPTSFQSGPFSGTFLKWSHGFLANIIGPKVTPPRIVATPRMMCSLISIQLSSANLTPCSGFHQEPFGAGGPAIVKLRRNLVNILSASSRGKLWPSYHPRPAQGKCDHWHQGYLWWYLQKPQRILHKHARWSEFREEQYVWGGGTQGRWTSCTKKKR